MRWALSIPGELILRAGVWLDPGITPCVKTLEAIVGAQQKNRSHSLDQSFMRGWPFVCTNLVPERPIEWFSHSQDPNRTFFHRTGPKFSSNDAGGTGFKDRHAAAAIAA